MQQVLSLIRGFLGEMGGQLAPEATIEEERYHLAPAEVRPSSGEFFEIADFPTKRMSLQLFQTGRSRTFLIGQIVTDGDVRPVHYASVASAVLHRDNGRLAPYTRPITADLVLIDLAGLDEARGYRAVSQGNRDHRHQARVDFLQGSPSCGNQGVGQGSARDGGRRAFSVQREPRAWDHYRDRRSTEGD